MFVRTWLSLVCIMMVGGCGDDGGGGDTDAVATTEAGSTMATPTSGPDTTGETSSGSETGAAACVEDDFVVFQELKGPGYDAAQGGLLEPIQDTYRVSGTVLYQLPDTEAEFLKITGTLVPVLMANPGMVAFSVGGSTKCATKRTLTLWRDEASMMAFVVSDAHAGAMAKTYEVSSGGTTTSWEIAKAEVPITWEAAIAVVDALPPSY